MTIKKHNALYLFSFLTIGILSFWLMGYYTEGDQSSYINAYEKIAGLPITEAYLQYYSIVSSLEFGHFAITWVASNLGMSKILLISIANGLLAFSFLYYGKKLNVSFIVLLPIVLLNFYFLAVYTELERLKFAFLFFILSFIFYDNKKYFYLFSALAVFTHLQFLIFYSGFLFLFGMKQLKNVLVNYKINWKLFIFIILLFVALLIMEEHLSRKLRFYFQGLDFLAVLKVLPLFFLALFYSKKRNETISIVVVLAIAILMLGGDRLNIFAYFVFLYYGLQYKKGFNLGIMITTIYFSAKAIIFIMNIFQYGRGY